MVYSAVQSPGQSPYDLHLLWNGNTTRLVLWKDPKTNLPYWSRRTASTTTAVYNPSGYLGYQSVPPEQGTTLAISGFKGGAGSRLYTRGRYAMGENIDTADGYARPGPVAEITGTVDDAPLSGPIKCVVRHNGEWYIGTEGVADTSPGKVYYWDSDDLTWIETEDQPDMGMDNDPITDLVSFGVVGTDTNYLIAFMDTAHKWAWSDDDGDTWTANNFPDEAAYGKHGCLWQDETSLRPRLVWVNDPYYLNQAEDPADGSTLVGPTYVGSTADSNADHFTSVSVSSNGATILAGKKLGWWSVTPTGGVSLVYPVASDLDGQGLENFAWPCQMGGASYVQVSDNDIVELTTIPNVGFGPFRAGQDLPDGGGIPELQHPVVAMCTDGVEWVYAALGGPKGRVMRGRYQSDGLFHWHGSFATLDLDGDEDGDNYIFNRMWIGSDPGEDRKQRYLWVSTTASPYTPTRFLIRNNPTDPDERYAELSSIRFGPDDAGQIQVDKLMGFSIPQSRNCFPASGENIELQYRTTFDGSFTTLNTFDESPEPTDPTTGQYPPLTTGKVLEIQAVLHTDSNAFLPPYLDAVVSRVFRRFTDGGYSPHVDILTFTVDAEQSARLGGNVQTGQTPKSILAALKGARGSLGAPVIYRPWDNTTWVVDIVDVGNERWIMQGNQPALIYDVVCQELAGATAGEAVAPPQYIGTLRYGTGAPSDGLGSNGDGYFDLDTTDFYRKAEGTWAQVSGGGGGGGTWGDITTGGTPEPLGDGVLLGFSDTEGDQGFRWNDSYYGMELVGDGNALGSAGTLILASNIGATGYPRVVLDTSGDVGLQPLAATGYIRSTRPTIAEGAHAPDNAVGNDDDITFYAGQVFAKVSGVWTAIVGSTGLTNPVGDNILLGLNTAGTAGLQWSTAFNSIELVGANFGIAYAAEWGFTGFYGTLGLPAMYGSDSGGNGTATNVLGQAGGGTWVENAGPIQPYYLSIFDTEVADGKNALGLQGFTVQAPTLTGAGMGATADQLLATAFVEGPPIAGAGMTFNTDPVALYVGGGDDAMRFGTHHGIGAETIDGYIYIRDDGGTLRKLAVIS